MLNLLSQAVDPELKEIGEAIAQGVSEGLKTTSENAPTNWILMITVVALACLGTWAIARFLTTLKEVSSAQDDRDKEHRAHVRDLSSEFNLRDREARSECHSHAKEIVSLSKEASSMIHATAADLKDVSKDTKSMVHDVRGMLHEHKGALDMALSQLGKPTIAQMFNMPPKDDPQPGEAPP